MKVKKTKLEGVLEIHPPTFFKDHRGEYIETYNKDLYFESGIKIDFLQDDISVSKKNVLRGLHGDRKTWKLVSCIYGSFYLIVVNNNEGSEQYRMHESFTLNDKDRKQILIPPGFANGHLILSDLAIFHYKQNTYYDRGSQFTILWDDPNYNFSWPIDNPILSERDAGNE
jgi:dTDP-4-dehydrorhamnose 3,5-epimerase